MFFAFFEELRRRKVPVGTHEALALAAALKAHLHDSSLEGFYFVARSLLVHRETHLDAFDQAFAHHFRGAADAGVQIAAELLEWLKEARERKRTLSPEEPALLEQLDRDELERLLQERLREQRERHDGGNKWIGTAGTSPFGHSGFARDGIRIGGPGGNRRAVQIAEARRFREYRDDVPLDVRQMSVALRKLRAFAREGTPDELDLDGTIDRTARNAGELEVVIRPPRRPNTRVILMMDVGGSMDPYADLVSRLFTAASKATHFKELRTYYFHDCIYGRLYRDARLMDGVPLSELFAECDKRYKVLLIGDALMAPYELLERTDASGWYHPQGTEGIVWLMRIAEHFPKSAWLNPEPPDGWFRNTIEVVRRVFPMFPLTLEGLGEAVGYLSRGAAVGR